jgi:hypothetical protein
VFERNFCLLVFSATAAESAISGISARVMKPKRGGKNAHKEVKQQVQ